MTTIRTILMIHDFYPPQVWGGARYLFDVLVRWRENRSIAIWKEWNHAAYFGCVCRLKIPLIQQKGICTPILCSLPVSNL